MLHNVLNDTVQSPYLVVFKSNFDRSKYNHFTVKILLHLIEKGVLWIMLIFSQISKELLDHSALKAEDLNKVCKIKLHERFKE